MRPADEALAPQLRADERRDTELLGGVPDPLRTVTAMVDVDGVAKLVDEAGEQLDLLG